MSPEEVDVLETNAHRELDESKIPMLVKIQCVYARKKTGETSLDNSVGAAI